ncbi:MAG TPA: hypothetical protein VKU01_22210 [Bryobacteraceae bacterium]|nr:hypothetical protein [Bryobacteraceae bacterium]
MSFGPLSGGGTITLSPGTYVLAGGGLTVNSTANITGVGVTFYNTASTSGNSWGCPFNTSHAPITFSGQGAVILQAPTTGSQVGMLFFDDRSIYDSRNNKIVGGASSTFDGALYFRNSPLTFGGSNSTSGYMVLVANTVNINGTSSIGNNYATLSDPNPFAPSSTGGGLVE